MKILKGVELNNVVLFKQAILPLNRKGVTVIKGKNLDSNSRITTTDNDTNAVGKTLLVSSIPELVFASSPLTQKIKTKAKKDFFASKHASIKLLVEENKKEFTFEKKTKGKSVEYLIHENGENTNVRTMKYPEQKIRNFFDMSEDEFFTLYYIDSSRPSSLQFGSATQRMDFFTNLFRLNNYDEVRKLFNGMIKEAKEASSVIKEIDSQLEELEGIEKSAIKNYKRTLEKYTKKAKSLSKEFSELHSLEISLEFVESNRKTFNTWAKVLSKLGYSADSVSEVVKIIRKAESKLEEIRANEKALAKLRAYKEQIKEYEQKKSKIEKQMSDLEVPSRDLDTDELKDISKEVLLLETKVKDLKKYCVETSEKLKARKKSFSKLDRLKDKTKKYSRDDLEKELEKLNGKKSAAKDAVESLKEVCESKNCPTCKQNINRETTRALIATCENILKKTGKKINAIKEILSDLDTYSDLKKEYKIYQEDKANFCKEVERLKSSEEKLSQLIKKKKKLERYEEYFRMKGKLDDLDKPKKPEILESKVDDADRELYSTIVNIGKIVEIGYEKFHSAPSDKSLEDVSARKKSIEKELSKYNEKIPYITSKLAVVKDSYKQIKKLHSRKKEHARKADDLLILEMLIEAYSNKGIKLLLIRQIASMIEKNMNKYAPLVYPEPIKFKFELKNDRDFSITYSRKKNKSMVTADVRRLSGAERRAFSFLLPLSIMPLIPHDRRLNLMVLDEPIANMGVNRMDLFVKAFVPKLNSIVPHVVIITTFDESYANSVTYTVTKKNGMSTLEKTGGI